MLMLPELFAQQVILVGGGATLADLPTAKQNAYGWAKSAYGNGAMYMSFDSIAVHGLPKTSKVIWYHFEDDPALPASDSGAISAIDAFVAKGGKILTSGFATEYLLDINVTTVAPKETIDNDPGGPDAAWGVRPFPSQASHPIFKGLVYNSDWADPNWSGFRTVSDSVAGREAIRWWTGNTYPGKGLAAMPWFAGEDLPIVGYIRYGKGIAMTCTAPGYNWVSSASNGANEQNNLERFSKNMLDYLGNIGNEARVILIGSGGTVADLPSAEQKAYNWALGYFGEDAMYMSFQMVADMGMPVNAVSVWYHFEDDPSLPADDSVAAPQIEQFVNNGGQLLVSGFATEYLLTTNATTVAPTETINNDPAGPDAAWGIRPFPAFETDRIFSGISNNTDWADPNWSGFRTISDSVAGREAMRWWTQNSYPGTGFAAMPWFGGEDLPVIGGILQGAGYNLTCTAPGFNWVNADINGAKEQDNLERLTANLLQASSPKILLIGDSATLNQLPDGERNAYQWAVDKYGAGAQYYSFDELTTNGLPSSGSVEVIWYHKEDDQSLPAIFPAYGNSMNGFLRDGGTYLLSGFATQTLQFIDTSFAATNETIDNDPAGPDAAWGVRPFPSKDQHPIFAGIPANTDWADPNWSGFRTVSDSVAGREAISWWTGNSYPGTGLAAMPWFGGEDLPIIGEILFGNGGIITCTAPGYNWVSADSNGVNEQNNLEMLTHNMLNYLGSYDEEQTISVSLMGGGNEIKENEEDGKVIEVSFFNTVLNDTINPANWAVSNLPGNISFTLGRVDDTNATITLSGVPDSYMDENITDFTVEVTESEFLNLRKEKFEDCGSVIFVADTATSIAGTSGIQKIKAYPNPVGTVVNIQYELSTSQQVKIEIIDLNGRTVEVLVDEVQAVGTHTSKWNANGVVPGVYLYKVELTDGTAVGKLIKR
ncbi:MAG: DUF4960 domain-containing protein [Bacteroidia bacterium]|nr:DUF4960 domain-containing protein [Bacteroidia bacterium]